MSINHPAGPNPSVVPSHHELPGAPSQYNQYRDRLPDAPDPFLGYQQELNKAPDPVTQDYKPRLPETPRNKFSGKAAHNLPHAPDPLFTNRGNLGGPDIDLRPTAPRGPGGEADDGSGKSVQNAPDPWPEPTQTERPDAPDPRPEPRLPELPELQRQSYSPVVATPDRTEPKYLPRDYAVPSLDSIQRASA
jgi:hypothetical protein